MLNLKRIVTPSVVMLGLFSVGIVSASGGTAEKTRSYEVSLNTSAKVGTQVLTPGDYKLRLEGANAVFTKQSKKEGDSATFTAPAKLEAGDEKFAYTAVHTVLDAGQPRIVSIELKGGKDLLKLN